MGIDIAEALEFIGVAACADGTSLDAGRAPLWAKAPGAMAGIQALISMPGSTAPTPYETATPWV